MSAEGAHVHKMSEGELKNSPVLSSLCSPNINAEYVFFFSKYNYYFRYYVVGGYYFVIIIIIIFYYENSLKSSLLYS